jgi:hypothetical protein
MKLIKNIAPFLGLIGSVMIALAVADSAQAQISRPADAYDTTGWCHIYGKMHFHTVGLILGGTEGAGRGHIKCEYSDGTEEDVHVSIQTHSVGLVLGEAEGTTNLFASGIGVALRGARSLLGTYATVKGSAQVIRIGGDAGLSLTLDRQGLSIPLTLQGRKGMGLQAGIEVGDFVFQEIAPEEVLKLNQPRKRTAVEQPQAAAFAPTQVSSQAPSQMPTKTPSHAGDQDLPPPPPM